MRLLKIMIFFGIAIMQFSCVTTPETKTSYNITSELNDYQSIQNSYKKNLFEFVIKQGQDFVKLYPETSQHHHQVRNVMGLSYLNLKLPEQAIYQLGLACEGQPQNLYYQYNLAVAQTEAKQYSLASETLKKIPYASLNPAHQQKYSALVQHLDILLAQSLPKTPDQIKAEQLALSSASNQPSTPVQSSTVTNAPLAPLESNKIGLLIPQSGNHTDFFKPLLQRIQNYFSKQPEAPQLVIRDSGETPESTQEALSKLYYEDHVLGVMGPFTSKGIESVTQKATDLHCPLITLTQWTQSQASDYVTNAGLTAKKQAETIAQFSLQTLGLKKFAILHSQTKFGEQYARYFTDTVTSLGGEVVGTASYSDGETDFRQAVDKLTRRNDTAHRQEELVALAKKREELKITKRTSKTEMYYSLPPIVEFEAVFIPDDVKTFTQAIPTFAYRDVDHMKFLGVSLLNQPELVSRLKGTRPEIYFSGGDLEDLVEIASESVLTAHKNHSGSREDFIDDLKKSNRLNTNLPVMTLKNEKIETIQSQQR